MQHLMRSYRPEGCVIKPALCVAGVLALSNIKRCGRHRQNEVIAKVQRMLGPSEDTDKEGLSVSAAVSEWMSTAD